MNILFITYGLPYPPHSGARLRDWLFIERLASEHSVHLLCLLEASEAQQSIIPLVTKCAAVETFELKPHALWSIRSFAQHLAAQRPLATYAFMDGRLMVRIAEITASKTIDAVQIEHSFLAPNLDALPPDFAGTTILDLHNIGALQYERIARIMRGTRARISFWLKAQLMRNWEARLAERFQHVITTSDDEARWLHTANPNLNVTVIENGVDSQTHQPLAASEGNHLLFVGTMGYPPNVDAMLWFCEEILPRLTRAEPSTTLTIVGRAPTRAVQRLSEIPNVVVTGHVEHLAPYYERAQIVIVPLRAGGGMRWKIFEAMAFGRAVVSTTMGCEGIAARDGETIRIADSPIEFADAVLGLLRNPLERERLARNARRLAETRYDWRALGDKLIDVYEQIHSTF